jgi:hypothetical protein
MKMPSHKEKNIKKKNKKKTLCGYFLKKPWELREKTIVCF